METNFSRWRDGDVRRVADIADPNEAILVESRRLRDEEAKRLADLGRLTAADERAHYVRAN